MSAFDGRPWSPAAQFARPACSDCRSRDIRWLAARDLPWEVDPGDRLRVFELIDWNGDHADAWFCPVCAAWGVFGEFV